MLNYKRVGLTVKRTLDRKDSAVERVLAILRKQGAEVFADKERMEEVACMKELPELKDCGGIDLLVVIGGDGTIMRAVRETKNCDVPILSVNKGKIGFLAETSIDEAEEWIPKLLSGEGEIEERDLLHVSVERSGTIFFEGLALNEAVIAQGAIARLLDLRARINGETLTTFHADGLIVATPTGSTAYSLAAGGPVVHPRLSALILTPINPHSFSQKPIVIPGESEVAVEVVPRAHQFENSEVSLTLDGQVYQQIDQHDLVRVKVHDETAKFLRRREDTFFATLREKLKWGERLED
jgi:NAD+ kinase